MPATIDSLHQRLHAATRVGHHALDHHRIMTPLLKPHVGVDDYGNALAALHGIVVLTETAIKAYLQDRPQLFDYAPRCKRAALETDLALLGRQPAACRLPAPAIDSAGALFGTLYVLEGATLGGQFIARRLLDAGSTLPLHFYQIYGAHTEARWQAFLAVAEAACPAASHLAAEAAAIAAFRAFQIHFDDVQGRFAAQ